MRTTTPLIAAWRDRRTRPMGDRESSAVGLLALAYVVAAVLVSLLLPDGRALNMPLVVATVIVGGILARIRVDVGTGTVSPTQLAFIPLLFLAPLPLVPLLVPVIFAVEELPDVLAGRSHVHRWVNWLTDSWFAIGPVLVLGLWANAAPTVDHWPIYLAALVAQVAVGAGASLLRERLAGQVAWRDELGVLVTAYQLEVLLAPAGVAAVALQFAAGPAVALAFVAASGAILWRAAVWHQARCTRAIGAYREEWAARLEDSAQCERARRGHVGPDWQPTAVVALALARQLALPAGDLRQLAHVAHHAGTDPDRGDLLTRAQAALCVTAVRGDLSAGTDVLGRDGDLVAAVGASWERYGDSIPLLSRVVAVARAYSVLTAATDNRAAYSHDTALDMLSRLGGRELEPRVVSVLAAAVADTDVDRLCDPVRPWLVGRMPASARL